GDQHVGTGGLECRDHVDGVLGGLLDGLPVVLAQSVEGRAALYDHPGRGDVADLDRVVLARGDRRGQVLADLLGVHVERRDELDVPDVVRTELHVHEAGHAGGRIGVPVVMDALDERGGTVAHAHDGYAYRTHVSGLLLLILKIPECVGHVCRGGTAGPGLVGRIIPAIPAVAGTALRCAVPAR